MSAKVAKWIFYLGTLISLVIFLGLTVDTHRQVQTLTNANKLDEKVVAGKRVWHKYNCNDCHTILGFGGYYAPDMTKVYWRRGEEGIKAVVRTPEKFTTWRKMPRQAVSEQELTDLVAFLRWTSEIDTNEWPPSGPRHCTIHVHPVEIEAPRPDTKTPEPEEELGGAVSRGSDA